MTQVLAGTIATDTFQQPAVIVVNTTPPDLDQHVTWWGTITVMGDRLYLGTYTLADHHHNSGIVALISRSIADDGYIRVYRYVGASPPPPAWMTPPQQGADNT